MEIRITDCHTSDVGHWFAMTEQGKLIPIEDADCHNSDIGHQSSLDRRTLPARRDVRNDSKRACFCSPVIARSEATWQSVSLLTVLSPHTGLARKDLNF